MDKFENPKPKPGESQKDFIARCIPYVHKEHPSWKMNKVKAVCYDIWRRSKNNNDDPEYEEFTDIVAFKILPKEDILANESGTMQNGGKRRLVAIIGNRFMNGGFLSAEELQKCYKQWEGTLHDINHMGTSTGFFLVQSDITYFIGYHSNVTYDKETKSVSMDLNVYPKTHWYAAWEAYMELCEMAGQIPNVSVTYYGKRKLIPASDLPPEADWKAEGFGKDDLVPVLYDVRPVCVSTVLQGRCNDKDGCGFNGESCNCDSCNDEDKEKLKKEVEERIKNIRLKEKQLLEDKKND